MRWCANDLVPKEKPKEESKLKELQTRNLSPEVGQAWEFNEDCQIPGGREAGRERPEGVDQFGHEPA